MIPSLLTTALVCTTTKNVPLYKFIPLDSHHHHHESGSPTDCWLGNLTDYIITSLSHQQKDPFMCNTIYITYLKSWFSIAQCPVCKLRCPCIQNAPVDITGIFMYMIQGHKREITDLVFENYKHVKKCIFRTLAQAGTNICSMGYQSSNFKTVCCAEE